MENLAEVEDHYVGSGGSGDGISRPEVVCCSLSARTAQCHLKCAVYVPTDAFQTIVRCTSTPIIRTLVLTYK